MCLLRTTHGAWLIILAQWLVLLLEASASSKAIAEQKRRPSWAIYDVGDEHVREDDLQVGGHQSRARRHKKHQHARGLLRNEAKHHSKASASSPYSAQDYKDFIWNQGDEELSLDDSLTELRPPRRQHEKKRHASPAAPQPATPQPTHDYHISAEPTMQVTSVKAGPMVCALNVPVTFTSHMGTAMADAHAGLTSKKGEKSPEPARWLLSKHGHHESRVFIKSASRPNMYLIDRADGNLSLTADPVGETYWKIEEDNETQGYMAYMLVSSGLDNYLNDDNGVVRMSSKKAPGTRWVIHTTIGDNACEREYQVEQANNTGELEDLLAATEAEEIDKQAIKAADATNSSKGKNGDESEKKSSFWWMLWVVVGILVIGCCAAFVYYYLNYMRRPRSEEEEAKWEPAEGEVTYQDQAYREELKVGDSESNDSDF